MCCERVEHALVIEVDMLWKCFGVVLLKIHFQHCQIVNMLRNRSEMVTPRHSGPPRSLSCETHGLPGHLKIGWNFWKCKKRTENFQIATAIHVYRIYTYIEYPLTIHIHGIFSSFEPYHKHVTPTRLICCFAPHSYLTPAQKLKVNISTRYTMLHIDHGHHQNSLRFDTHLPHLWLSAFITSGPSPSMC